MYESLRRYELQRSSTCVFPRGADIPAVAVADHQPHKNRVEKYLFTLITRVRSFILEPAGGQTFEELALEIFRFQFEFNQPYAAYCRSLGATPDTVDHYSRIPAMITSAFKELDLTVLPANDRPFCFHSSGTTEQRPSRHYHSVESMGLYTQAAVIGFNDWLLPRIPLSRFVLLSPTPDELPHSSLIRMFDSISAAYGAGATYTASRGADGSWVLNFPKILNLADEQMNTNQPALICGTAFSYVHLCDFLAARKLNLQFPRGSKVFETGGYKGRSRSVAKHELHEMIERYLGIPQTHIVSEYGMSELSSQAYDRVAGNDTPRIYRFPHWARAEVISPETGKPVGDGEHGLVRVYDLANVASVMAIQTEDLATWRGEGFELLGRAAQSEARGCSLMNAA